MSASSFSSFPYPSSTVTPADVRQGGSAPTQMCACARAFELSRGRVSRRASSSAVGVGSARRSTANITKLFVASRTIGSRAMICQQGTVAYDVALLWRQGWGVELQPCIGCGGDFAPKHSARCCTVCAFHRTQCRSPIRKPPVGLRANGRIESSRGGSVVLVAQGITATLARYVQRESMGGSRVSC